MSFACTEAGKEFRRGRAGGGAHPGGWRVRLHTQGTLPGCERKWSGDRPGCRAPAGDPIGAGWGSEPEPGPAPDEAGKISRAREIRAETAEGTEMRKPPSNLRRGSIRVVSAAGARRRIKPRARGLIVRTWGRVGKTPPAKCRPGCRPDSPRLEGGYRFFRFPACLAAIA